MTPKKRIAIVGASGYTGRELVRLLAHHPSMEATHVMGSREGQAPDAPELPVDFEIELLDLDKLRGLDGVFLCTPHGTSAPLAKQILARGAKVVDLSADFRLDHRHNGQLFHLPLSFTPEEMVIDPDLWLVRGVSKVTGSEEVKTNQTFSLFPNPFDQAFTISLPPGAECLRVTLSDMAGRTVFENRGEALTLNPAIPPGTYILRVVTLDESYVWKLVKNASRAAAVR